MSDDLIESFDGGHNIDHESSKSSQCHDWFHDGQDARSLATIAAGYMKKNLNAVYGGSLSDTFDREALHMMRCFMTQDHKRAAQAFVDKTSPKFLGS